MNPTRLLLCTMLLDDALIAHVSPLTYPQPVSLFHCLLDSQRNVAL